MTFLFLLHLSNCAEDKDGVEFDENFQTLISTPPSLEEYTVPASCTTILGGSIETSSFRASRNSIKRVDFEENSVLTTIEDSVFEQSSIEVLNFSNCELLKSLPLYFCNFCYQLKTLILPPNVETIGGFCFRFTTALKYVKFPVSLKQVSSFGFQWSGLSTIDIPYDSKLEILSGDCFAFVKATSFYLPKTFTTYGGACFLSSSITNITIHESNNLFSFDNTILYNKEKTIVYYAISGVKEVSLPSTVKTIIASAFRSTTLESITFNGPVESIGIFSFAAITTLKTFAFPNGTKIIPRDAMMSCTRLETVTFPSSAVSIESEAFKDCKSLKNIFLHEGITTIKTGAFSGCSSLFTLDLPASLTNLESGVFTGCTNLEINGKRNTNIKIFNQMLFVKQKTQLNEYFGENPTIQIPSFCSIIGNSAFVSTVVEHVSFESPRTLSLSIEESAFAKTNLISITFPSGLTSIGIKCFSGCSKLQSIDLKLTQITQIPANCFHSCTALTTFLTPSQLNKIDEYAFYQCTSLNTFDFMLTSISSIGNYAFTYANFQNSKIEFPSSLATLGYSSFEGTQMNELILTNSQVSVIPLRCFALNKNLNSLQFNTNKLERIEDEAFEGCISLNSFTLPQSLQNLDQRSFYGCTNLEIVHFPSNSMLEVVRGQAFGNCPNLVNLDIPGDDTKFKFRNYILFDAPMTSIFLYLPSNPSSICVVPALVNNIKQYAFEDCVSLQQVIISYGVLTTIGNMAFKGCTKLSFIYLPSTLTSIGSQSFQGCTSLGCGSVIIDGNNNSIKEDLQNIGGMSSIVFSTACYKHAFSCICYRSLFSQHYLFCCFLGLLE